MSRFSDLFQEQTPNPVTEPVAESILDTVIEPVVKVDPIIKKPLPKNKFNIN